MATLQAALEERKDRDWLACFVLAVLTVPCIALTIAAPGLVAKSLVVGVAMVLAMASYAAGRSAAAVESVLESAAVHRHPAQGRADAEQ